MVTQFDSLDPYDSLKFEILKIQDVGGRHFEKFKIRHFLATRNTMVTSDFRTEVEVRQFRTCTLKNDSVDHNGLSYGADTTFH